MKYKRCAALLLSLLAFMLPAAALNGTACAAEEAAKPLLVTWYRQQGWGSKMQAGYLDDRGDLWFGALADASGLSFKTPEAVVAYFCENGLFERAGEVDSMRMAELESMIAPLDEDAVEQVGCANDAGTEYSYAFQNSEDGTETILLGTSGDRGMANGNENAQALYFELRALFPDVTSRWGNAPFLAESCIDRRACTESSRLKMRRSPRRPDRPWENIVPTRRDVRHF